MFNFLKRSSKGDAFLLLLGKEAQKHNRYLSDNEFANLNFSLRTFAEQPSSSEARRIATYGPLVVVPLLVLHGPRYNAETRESVIYLLLQITDSIINEIKDFMSQASSWDDTWSWSRYTAFWALVQRATQNQEDKNGVMAFVRTLKNDNNYRIRDELDSAIGHLTN